MKITGSTEPKETLSQEMNVTNVRKPEKASRDSESTHRLMTAEAAAIPRLQKRKQGFENPGASSLSQSQDHPGLRGGSRNSEGDEAVAANK